MKAVTIIHCRRSTFEEKKPLKVAAYCRVSTEYEEQMSSLEFRVSHFLTMKILIGNLPVSMPNRNPEQVLKAVKK